MTVMSLRKVLDEKRQRAFEKEKKVVLENHVRERYCVSFIPRVHISEKEH